MPRRPVLVSYFIGSRPSFSFVTQDPVPKPAKKRGRPRKRIRGKKSQSLPLPSTPTPSTPEPSTPPNSYSPLAVDVSGSSASPATSNLLQLKAQAVVITGHGSPLTSQKHVRGEKEYLAKVIRRPEKGWRLVEGGLATHQLPEFFERQVSVV